MFMTEDEIDAQELKDNPALFLTVSKEGSFISKEDNEWFDMMEDPEALYRYKEHLKILTKPKLEATNG